MSTELSALEEISKLLGDKKPEKPKKDEPAPPIRPLFTVSDLQALKEGEVIINRFRSMPFKTTLKYDYKIDWGKKYPPMKYHERERHEVKVFDVKAYVNKLREEKGIPAGPMGMNGMPMGMMGGMMGGLPNPFLNSSPSAPVPGGRSTAGMAPTSLDDYISMLDKKIAELEKEEEEERKKIEEQKKKEKASVKESTDAQLEGKSDVLSESVEPEVPSSSAEVANIAPTMFTGFKDKEIQDANADEIPPMKKGEPVIDSKVSTIAVTDDQFFDDFFDE
jgi:hypothetical protein